MENTLEAIHDSDFESFIYENPLTPINPDSDSESVITVQTVFKAPEVPPRPTIAETVELKKAPTSKSKGRYRKPETDLRKVVEQTKTKEKNPKSKVNKIKSEFKSVRKTDYESLKKERDNLLKDIGSIQERTKAKITTELLPVFFNLEKVHHSINSQIVLVKELERKIKKILEDSK